MKNICNITNEPCREKMTFYLACTKYIEKVYKCQDCNKERREVTQLPKRDPVIYLWKNQ